MKIEVKNISVSLANSQETHCFSATVHVDGKKAFAVRNDGWGGSNMVDRVPGYDGPSEKEVDDFLKRSKPVDTSYGVPIEHDLEIEVGDQVNAYLMAQETKRVRRELKRKLTKSLYGLKEGSLLRWKAPPTEQNIERLKDTRPDIVVVNGASEAIFEQALIAFCPDLAE